MIADMFERVVQLLESCLVRQNDKSFEAYLEYVQVKGRQACKLLLLQPRVNALDCVTCSASLACSLAVPGSFQRPRDTE